jgi:hypothetical protein
MHLVRLHCLGGQSAGNYIRPSISGPLQAALAASPEKHQHPLITSMISIDSIFFQLTFENE